MRTAEIDFSRFTLRGDLPAHRQVAAYLKAIIALGQLNTGDPVPGAPALAYRLKVPAAEVRRAFAELSDRGFLASENGKWRVSDGYVAAGSSREAEEICDRMSDLIVEARKAGMSRGELQRMFDELLGRS